MHNNGLLLLLLYCFHSVIPPRPIYLIGGLLSSKFVRAKTLANGAAHANKWQSCLEGAMGVATAKLQSFFRSSHSALPYSLWWSVEGDLAMFAPVFVCMWNLSRPLTGKLMACILFACPNALCLSKLRHTGSVTLHSDNPCASMLR